MAGRAVFEATGCTFLQGCPDRGHKWSFPGKLVRRLLSPEDRPALGPSARSRASPATFHISPGAPPRLLAPECWWVWGPEPRTAVWSLAQTACSGVGGDKCPTSSLREQDHSLEEWPSAHEAAKHISASPPGGPHEVREPPCLLWLSSPLLPPALATHQGHHTERGCTAPVTSAEMSPDVKAGSQNDGTAQPPPPPRREGTRDTMEPSRQLLRLPGLALP